MQTKSSILDQDTLSQGRQTILNPEEEEAISLLPFETIRGFATKLIFSLLLLLALPLKSFQHLLVGRKFRLPLPSR